MHKDGILFSCHPNAAHSHQLSLPLILPHKPSTCAFAETWLPSFDEVPARWAHAHWRANTHTVILSGTFLSTAKKRAVEESPESAPLLEGVELTTELPLLGSCLQDGVCSSRGPSTSFVFAIAQTHYAQDDGGVAASLLLFLPQEQEIPLELAFRQWMAAMFCRNASSQALWPHTLAFRQNMAAIVYRIRR